MKIKSLVAVLAFGALLVGCGQGEPETSKEAQKSDETAAKSAASTWTPEMKDKFTQAMAGHVKRADGSNKKDGDKSASRH